MTTVNNISVIGHYQKVYVDIYVPIIKLLIVTVAKYNELY